jgi:hypothetical protein
VYSNERNRKEEKKKNKKKKGAGHADGRPFLFLKYQLHIIYYILIRFLGLLVIVKKTFRHECCHGMFLLKTSCTTVSSCLIQCFVKVDVHNFLDLQAIASSDSDDLSTDDEEQESDRASYLYFFYFIYSYLIYI